ncbi:MAG: hypothetical protein GVY17_09075 [Cyanobacteria bacterium]|nr:hypothetical protein [Cyanobacteria bacterium GSL.Bin21]
MTHTFLLEPGQWILKGVWCEANVNPLSVEGTVTILWNQPNWFRCHKQLKFPDHQTQPNFDYSLKSPELILTYRGYLGYQQTQYTFVLKHNILGNLEGNGWMTPTWIMQRYWVLNDRKRRQGFETLYQETADTYRLCSGLNQGHQIMSTLEATLVRSST